MSYLGGKVTAMFIPREEIVREFILVADSTLTERLFAISEAADVAERLIDRAIEIDRDPNCEGTAAFAYSNDFTLHMYVIAKLSKLLPGPRGGEVMLTSDEWAIVRQAMEYVGDR
jgi:hypothetical protein